MVLRGMRHHAGCTASRLVHPQLVPWQGFVVSADMDGGFGGAARDMMVEFADVYPRVPCTFMALAPPSATVEPIYDVNVAICTSVLSEFSKIFCPISIQVGGAATEICLNDH